MTEKFTEEGLLLAIFKLSIENNGMLRSLTDAVSRIYSEMPTNIIPDETAEGIKIRFEEAMKRHAKALEHFSLQSANSFASSYDSHLAFEPEDLF